MSQTTARSTDTDPTIIERHPFRGLLWGILMGIGLAVVLVVTKVIDLELTMLIIVTAAAIVLGVIWGLAGPAKPPKGLPPSTRLPVVTPPPASRFDDFDAPGPAAPENDPSTADADRGDVQGGDDAS